MMRNSMRMGGLLTVSSSPERPVEDEFEAMRRQQRVIWSVLALVAVVEVLLGGWLVGMLPR